MSEQVRLATADAVQDTALIAAVAAGDQRAAAAFYDRFAGLVYSIAMRMLGDRTAAEELTSDVFIEAWRRAPDYSAARGSVATWIATITRSRGIDRIRARQRRKVVELDATTASATAPLVEPGRELIASEDRTRINAGLSGLTGEQRQALELAYFDGLTHVEVAERLARPLGTVKTHIRQGLIQLRQALRTNGEDLA